MEAEAAHGTVIRQYRQHQKGNKISTHPIDLIFAWTRRLVYRGKFDDTSEVCGLPKPWKKVCIETVDAGSMTKDLALLVGGDQVFFTTEEFLAQLDNNLQK